MQKTEISTKPQNILSMPCSIIALKPNNSFKDWVAQLCAHESSLMTHPEVLTLDEISQDSVVFCVPQFMLADEYQQYLEYNYKKLLEVTLSAWCPNKEWWPAINNYASFLMFLTPALHSNVYDAYTITSLTNTPPTQNVDLHSSHKMLRMKGMMLLLSPLREFWVSIQKIEHKLPADLQANLKNADGIKLLDMNSSAYCIPEYTTEADFHQFILDQTHAFLAEELMRWGVPFEHAQTFHASGSLSTFFNIELHSIILFDSSELADDVNQASGAIL
jgi:hypothetical protein